jgi:hypothetical protein
MSKLHDLTLLLPLALLLGCPPANDDDVADDDDATGDDDDATGDDDDATGDDDDATGDDDDATGDDDDATGDDDDATGDDDDATGDDDDATTGTQVPDTGWWLLESSSIDTDTCGVGGAVPAFRIDDDGGVWTMTTAANNVGQGSDETVLSCVVTPGVDIVCSAVVPGNGFTANVELTSSDFWQTPANFDYTVTVILGSSTCGLTGSATAVPWVEPDPAACGSDALTPEVTPTDGVLTAVVSAQTTGNFVSMAYATYQQYDVEFPAGTALGSDPGPLVDGDRWASMIALNNRFSIRVVPDNPADLATFYPTNFAGKSDAANSYVFPRVHRRELADQIAQLGGQGPALPEFGQMEVITRQSNGTLVNGATVTVGGTWEVGYNLDNNGAYHTAGAAQTGALTTQGGNVYVHNVCPGMVPVSVTDPSGAACTVAPYTTDTSIEVAVRADEYSAVEFICR